MIWPVYRYMGHSNRFWSHSTILKDEKCCRVLANQLERAQSLAENEFQEVMLSYQDFCLPSLSDFFFLFLLSSFFFFFFCFCFLKFVFFVWSSSALARLYNVNIWIWRPIKPRCSSSRFVDIRHTNESSSHHFSFFVLNWILMRLIPSVVRFGTNLSMNFWKKRALLLVAQR